MRAAQGCFGAAQSFKNKAEKDNLRIYGLEGALVEEGEVFTRNRESSYRRKVKRRRQAGLEVEGTRGTSKSNKAS